MVSRRWALTVWDDAPLEWDPSWMTYLLYGKEVAPTTGKHHWQTYLETSSRLTLRGLLSRLTPLLDVHPYAAAARGDATQNAIYCVKDGEWVEYGDPFKQGHRSDLDEAVAAVLAGEVRVDDILTEQPMMYHQYGRTLRDAEDLYLSRLRRDQVPRVVHWYWGDTGAGKSRLAFDQAGDDCYVYTNDDRWWDNYKGQKKVVFDEFRGGIKFQDFLRLLDRYHVTVSRRGRAPIPFMADEIWITSSKTPQQCYAGVGEDVQQLVRRCTDIVRFTTF